MNAAMRSFFGRVLPRARHYKHTVAQFLEWARRSYEAPSPDYVKHALLARHGTPDCVWIETGTYLGDTTEFLRKRSKFVFSIEVDQALAERATSRFARTRNVQILHGDSARRLEEVLPKIQDPARFWLDGHYSGGITGKGGTDTPIVAELDAIAVAVKKGLLARGFVVLVDDVRCFDPGNPLYADYPRVDFLVEWAHRLGAKWHIEHDVFVADARGSR
jgi:hypothetical protein